MENDPNWLSEISDEALKHFVMENYVGGQVGYPVHSQALVMERTADKVVIKMFPNADDVCITFTFTESDVSVDKPILYAGLVEDNLSEKYKAFLQEQKEKNEE